MHNLNNYHKQNTHGVEEKLDKQKATLQLEGQERTKLNINNEGGVAWSSGQHRRLPFQGSRDRIPVFLFLLFG